jgi:hypothetical protein
MPTYVRLAKAYLKVIKELHMNFQIWKDEGLAMGSGPICSGIFPWEEHVGLIGTGEIVLSLIH